RLFHRVQVATLDVLDERELQHLLVFDFADDDGHARKARELRGAPAALARDELEEAGAGGADDDRLEQAVLLQRLRERLHGFGVELGARLVRVRPDGVDLHRGGRLGAWLGRDRRGRFGLTADKRAETHAETFDLRHDFPLYLSPVLCAGNAACANPLYHPVDLFAVIILPGFTG